MNTPICDFVKEYAEKNYLRLHMPGHKGVPYLGFEKFDITEIDGADVLYSENGIIKESEKNAAELFGTAKTLYSTEGSSLAIRAMLYLTKIHAESKGEKIKILAGRNAHKTFITACALLDIDVSWIFPKEHDRLVSCEITSDCLDEILTNMKNKPTAVYITSPDYLGNIADIKNLSMVCKKHNTLLLVDNAHGAYLNFLNESLHPISIGADICCDSAHKTLPVLTGGAYLHVSKFAPEIFKDKAEDALSLFASTSPSYLVLQSLDHVNKYLSEGYFDKLNSFTSKINRLKEKLENNTYKLVGNEPLKLAIDTKGYGYTGYQFKGFLNENGIVCEFYDPDYVVMMFTPEISDSQLEKLERVLLSIERKKSIAEELFDFSEPKVALTPKEALFSESIKLPVEKSVGKILSNPNVSCPPAIPIVVCGEIIDENTVKTFNYYGIKSCNVVK